MHTQIPARFLRAHREEQASATWGTSEELAAQEAQIARLARDDLTNSEIGGQLFIGPRLGHVFAKLDIASRRQLRRVLPDPGSPTSSA